jgi:ATP-dependent RNA helicase SUPV3L1/SUV3
LSELRAILGPTNTGKTYVALEECLQHPSGVLGFPLRLLAREAYDRLVLAVGADAVALVTGEEKRIGAQARYFCCTVEAMPSHRDNEDFAFVAIDEVQLCADAERGHIFTDRVLHRRGTKTTLLLGADTAAPVLQRLLPGLVVERRARLSQLRFAGHKKLARLPKRSAVVAFSMAEVYRLAEEARHHHGGCAVVLGALSPRTRNAQVAMFQAGEVDVIVATDAIGMGLNLDIHHVAFAGTRKFDGDESRSLSDAELAQIAGRAGRHVRDGTFGTTANCAPLDADVVHNIEHHRLAPLSQFRFRQHHLEFSSADALLSSLRRAPDRIELTFGRIATDLLALQTMMRHPDVIALRDEEVERLWQVCQIPDFEKLSPDEHHRLLWEVWQELRHHHRVRDSWMATRVQPLMTGSYGDVESLLSRLTSVRSVAYVAQQRSFGVSSSWQMQVTTLEENLSDALHAALQQRFVDRLGRAVLTGRGLQAAVDHDGDVEVGGESVGTLKGLRFVADNDDGRGGLRHQAAAKALLLPLRERLEALLAAPDTAFGVDCQQQQLLWADEAVGRWRKGSSLRRPTVDILTDAHGWLAEAKVRDALREKLSSVLLRKVDASLRSLWLLAEVELPGAARGVRHQLIEQLGVMPRIDVEESLGRLQAEERKALTRAGVRLGFRDVFARDMFKDAAVAMRASLWCLWHDRPVPPLPPAGASSFLLHDRPAGFVELCGFHVIGDDVHRRAYRTDLLDKNLLALTQMTPPFPLPTSLCESLGCSRTEAEQVLGWCGYRRLGLDGAGLGAGDFIKGRVRG